MSRCFPYPPPGYTLSRASEEALIESIKLQKERKSKEERKKDKKREKEEKKKEKKEKKKEKKEKKKEKKDKTHQNLDKSGIVQGHIGKSIWPDAKGELLHKGGQAEPEQLEGSSLTEERGQPARLCAPSTSSDSTENSNKRKRDSSPADGACGHSKIIRIRLPSKKPNESHASDQICSTSGRTLFPSQNKDDISLRHSRGNVCCASQGTSNIGQGLSRKTDREQICSTSGQISPVTAVKTGIPSANNTVMTPMQRMELQYKNLIENWVPPQWQDSSDGQDWLFQGKTEGKRAEKRQKGANDSLPYSSSSAVWPHVQYLQDVDVYALPFTVPF
ncbi:hypothetical protein Salat_1241100 [Sesamum alatum]|uniref:Uncharacterized protein n=1 Tax=Sesamum alatum TaxID=300844 RepID=A0AAE2CP85_9LAMI|nr:hypothetical protein Salat_1241100 [Sesamum alatum]